MTELECVTCGEDATAGSECDECGSALCDWCWCWCCEQEEVD